MLDEHDNGVDVAIYSKVIHVPLEPSFECGVLYLYRLVSIASAPVGDGHECPSEARLASFHARFPALRSSSGPKHREPEKVEGCPAFAVEQTA